MVEDGRKTSYEREALGNLGGKENQFGLRRERLKE